MDYDDGEAADRERLKVIVLAVLGIVIVGATLAAAYFYIDRYGLSAEERFERELAKDRSAAVALEPMRRLYPYDYAQLRSAAAEKYNLTEQGRVLDRIAPDFMRHFFKRHAVEALQGGDKETLAFIQAYAEVFDRAASDETLCKLLSEKDDRLTDAQLAFAQKPFTHLFATFVDMAASGRRNPVKRVPASYADMDSWRRALVKLGVTPRQMIRAAPSQECKQQNVQAKALRGLPEDQQIRLISVLLQLWR